MKKVDRFSLSKEQVSHLKEVEKVNATKALLAKGALQEWFKRGNALKRIFDQLDERQKMLNAVAPSEEINELPGQETVDEGRELFGGREDGAGMGAGAGAGMGAPNRELVR